MNETPNAFQTASCNLHWLTADGKHLVCRPNKSLPKGQKLSVQGVACMRCNKENRR